MFTNITIKSESINSADFPLNNFTAGELQFCNQSDLTERH